MEREAQNNVPEKKRPDRRVRRRLILSAAVILTAGAAVTAAVVGSRRKEEVVYKETTAEYGPLTVGITESGNVEVATTTQNLTLDISAYSSSRETDGFAWMMGPAMQAGDGSSSGSSSQGRELIVNEIFVNIGERIEKGDPLFALSEESVDELRKELVSDVTDARLSLEQTRTEQKKSDLSASHAYETNTTYGEAAQIEYDETVQELSDACGDAMEALSDAGEELAGLQEELAELQAKLEEDTHLYNEAAYLVTYIDMEEDPYGYTNALALRDSSRKTKEDREDEIEKKEEEIEEKQKSVTELSENLTTAEAAKKTGEIKAKALYDSRILRYRYADELYAVETSQSALKSRTAQDEYDRAEKKLKEFDACIQDYNVVSEYDGVITQVDVSRGDSLAKGSSLVTLNNYDEVTVSVTVEDDDIGQIREGDEVNIYLPSFPEDTFKGVVEEIGEGQVDAYSSGVTYGVTVNIQGDVSGIYAGMSAEVTFITKETQNVVYILNRAVNRDGTRSYVYVRDEDGKVVQKDIETGFSDGIYAEVKQGLSQGDTVLMESKVGGS